MKFTFKRFRADKSTSPDTPGETQTPQQRRREQVRRAQKTHRERKEAYTRELETEVTRLRTNEVSLLQETRNLYAEVDALRNLLACNGIPAPPPSTERRQNLSSGGGNGGGFSQPGSSTSSTFILSIPEKSSKKKAPERIYIQRGAAGEVRSDRSASGPLSSSLSSSTTPSNRPSSPEMFALPSFPRPGDPGRFNPPRHMCDLDATSIGMDFVLTLESPCFQHIDVGPNHPSATGHALTTTATLLHQHHDFATEHVHAQEGSSRSWQVSDVGIERLLELSRSVPLNGEITPVQAWDYIRRHDRFASLELERFVVLKKRLLDHIKCHGFGGVMDQIVFENTVFEVFVVGRIF